VVHQVASNGWEAHPRKKKNQEENFVVEKNPDLWGIVYWNGQRGDGRWWHSREAPGPGLREPPPGAALPGVGLRGIHSLSPCPSGTGLRNRSERRAWALHSY